MEGEKARRWLIAGMLVALAHAGAWYVLSRLPHEITPPRPLKVIEVALLTPPPQPKIAVKLPEPAKPVAKAQTRTKPEPRQLLQAQAIAERTMEQAPETPPPSTPTPPVAAAEPPKAAPEPVVEAPRFNAAYLNNPPPAYPLTARRRGMEGRVMVRAEVLADGTCSRVELKQSSGYEPLDQAALEAVKKWRFIPAKKGSLAITAWVEVPITFKLEN